MRNINFEITGKSYDTTVKVEYDHADIDVEKLFESFFTVARGLGWQDETIREHIMELAAQYKDDTTDDIQKYDDGFDDDDVEDFDNDDEDFDDDEDFPGWGHHPFRSGEPTGSHSAESATIPEWDPSKYNGTAFDRNGTEFFTRGTGVFPTRTGPDPYQTPW